MVNNMDKKMMILACLIIAAVMILPQTASARKGVGIVWDTETEIVTEGSTRCIGYGVYNPWEEDVTAILSISDELKDVVTEEESETKLIEAGTMHDNAVPIEFCFTIPKIYEEDCLLPGFFCEQTCEQPEIAYDGSIVAMEQIEGSAGGAAGSATSLGVSVPLKLKVRCDAHPRDWSLAFVIIIVVILIIIGLYLRKLHKSHKSRKKKK